jgi:hypothetical protein
MEISPSLRLTLDPPRAFRRDETGRLMNEKTDLPALDTCAAAGVIPANAHRRINRSDMCSLNRTITLS